MNRYVRHRVGNRWQYKDKKTGRFVKKSLWLRQQKKKVKKPLKVFRATVQPQVLELKPTPKQKQKILQRIAKRGGVKPKKKAYNVQSRNIFEKREQKPVAEFLTQQAKERASARLFNMIKNVKFNKEDEGKYFYVGINGQKLSKNKQGNRLAYLVKVSSGNKLVVYNRTDPNTVTEGNESTGYPLPEKIRLLSLRKIMPDEKGFAFARPEKSPSQPFSQFVTQTFKSGEIDKFLNKAVWNWHNLVMGQRDYSQWQVHGFLKIKGMLKPIEFWSDILRASKFFAFDGETRILKAFRQWKEPIWNLIYQGVAVALARFELVSVGSVRRVSKYSFNRGKRKQKWADKRGNLWEAGGVDPYQESEITEIEWRIEQTL